MAAPADSPEQAFRLRRFSGVNTLTDPVFLGAQFLSLARNWVPNQTFRLSKKPGSRQYLRVNDPTDYGVDNITALGRYYAPGGRYLYFYGQATVPGDRLFRLLNDGATTPLDHVCDFPAVHAIGRMIRYGDYLYVGNGTDPLRQVHLETGDVNVLVPITLLDITITPTVPDPGRTLVPIDPTTDGTPRLQDGSYEYAWAIYDKTTKLYTHRTDPFTLVVQVNQYWKEKAPPTDPNAVAPTVAGSDRVYRLFVAPQGWPIEYATAQGKDWAADEERSFSAFEVTTDRVPVTNNVERTGNIFTVYRNRVVFAGSLGDPNALCATGVILPGLESDTFNQGAFFPAAARIHLPARVTALGVSGSTGPQDPRSPLVAATPTKLYLFLGDPFDPSADFSQVQLSDHIGCPAHDTMVPTSEGLMFMGNDSVYLLPSDGAAPIDVGWPIADQIREIEAGDRSLACAIHHKHFYKLAIPSAGGGQNVLQWWLDLRQGIGDVPSWWGPHVGPPVSAFATALQDPDEADKGFAAQASTDLIFLHHQMNLYFDMDVPITSVLRTGVFDAEQPFLPKVFTRVRAIARAARHTTIRVQLITDGGATWAIDAIDLVGPEGAKWYGTLDVDNRARWSRSRWLHLGPLEVQTITPVERPRGLSVEMLLTHSDATDVQLRDFEILFVPTGRKVRYLGEKVPM
jgi:hypothetical protein